MLRATFLGIAVLTLLAGTTPSHAAIVQFSGSDDGAGVGGPFPNSSSAQSSFAAAASGMGTLSTITFEDLPTSTGSSFTAAPGVTVTWTGPNYGLGYSGISSTTFGGLYGFNTTPGGTNWFGFSDAATFTFATGINAFGFTLSGVQTVFQTRDLLVTFSNGVSQSFSAPVNVNGGLSFFGFTDAGSSITSVSILAPGPNDAWGIDDVMFATPLNVDPPAVPEPGSLALAGMGAVGLVAAARRRRQQAA